jgi:hypothetical protein
MPEEMNWKKFLTEKVLHETWHESNGAYLGQKCICGRECRWPRETLDEHIHRRNRAFNYLNDMMELYRAIYKDRKWTRFADFVFKYYKDVPTTEIFDAWLFCLGDEDYESRCKLVAEFCGWKEEK